MCFFDKVISNTLLNIKLEKQAQDYYLVNKNKIYKIYDT